MFDQECIQNNIIKTDKIQITTKEGETRSVLTIRHHPALLDTEDEKYIITFFVDITQMNNARWILRPRWKPTNANPNFLPI